jgi:hypothetical protein
MFLSAVGGVYGTWRCSLVTSRTEGTKVIPSVTATPPSNKQLSEKILISLQKTHSPLHGRFVAVGLAAER